jgi:GTP-binding protein HflX
MINYDELSLPSHSKAYIFSIVSPNLDYHKDSNSTENSLNELRELLRTLEIDVLGQTIQNRSQIDPATMLGKGKLQEIAERAKNEGADFLVCDFELTASQSRNIKNLTGFDIVDRVSVILEIFAHHAKTKEAKIQIQISKLEYLLPRLSSLWTHFSKQKGGIGLKGEGEQQLELDRRIVRQKIRTYKKQLKEIEQTRIQQRKKRQNIAITAALVGYTNAGKSSLMNRLCRVNVLEEDKLFATLDSTFRMLNPDTKPPMILIDTVGFISNLPNTLITGFRTTLESALEADLLILVCDISDPQFQEHLKVTQGVLEELNLQEKPQLLVFNKMDKVDNPFKQKIVNKQFPNSFFVSSFNENDVNRLRDHIIHYFLDQQESFDLFVPYSLGHIHSILMSKTNVLKSVNHENGIFYQIKVPQFLFNTLGLNEFILSPEEKEKFQPFIK